MEREGMECGDDAGEGILRHGCGRKAMPGPVGTARASQRRRSAFVVPSFIRLGSFDSQHNIHLAV